MLVILAGSSVEVSNTPPSAVRTGAVRFVDWKLLGHEFMAASNINNWVGITSNL